jgi:hypothetical protein
MNSRVIENYISPEYVKKYPETRTKLTKISYSTTHMLITPF